MGLNRELGNKGELPWRLPEDLAFFKNTTLGHSIIMGRSTYESFKKPLPERHHIVISSTGVSTSDNVECFNSIDEFMESTRDTTKDIYVIGGASIYKQFLPICDKLLITEIQSSFEADTFMPEFHSSFKLTEQSEVLTSGSGLQYKFTTYEKI